MSLLTCLTSQVLFVVVLFPDYLPGDSVLLPYDDDLTLQGLLHAMACGIQIDDLIAIAANTVDARLRNLRKYLVAQGHGVCPEPLRVDSGVLVEFMVLVALAQFLA